MIVLDTNVVLELMRPRPASEVRHWFRSQPARELFLAATTVGELEFGAARLPAGRRRVELAARVATTVDDDFAGRVLSLDVAAAKLYGRVVADRERIGPPIGLADAQIAAICLHHGASLATRNTRDFEEFGLTLIDPWTA